MKTIRTWLNELPENEREKAFRYERAEWDKMVSSMLEAIYWAFPWSTKGYNHWAYIADRYK